MEGSIIVNNQVDDNFANDSQNDDQRRSQVFCSLFSGIIESIVYIIFAVFGALNFDNNNCQNGAETFLFVMGMFMVSDVIVKTIIKIVKIYLKRFSDDGLSPFMRSILPDVYITYKQVINGERNNDERNEGNEVTPSCFRVGECCCLYYLCSAGVQLGILIGVS